MYISYTKNNEGTKLFLHSLFSYATELTCDLKDQQNTSIFQPTCNANDNGYIHSYVFSACVQHMCLYRSS